MSVKINPPAAKPQSVIAKKNEYKTDLRTLAKCQLMEIWERQKKLASNSKALSRLPDKGAKILKYLKEVEEEVERRDKENDINTAMAGLTLKQLDRLEWTRDEKELAKAVENVEQDEANPFRILATHSGAGFHKKEIKEDRKEEPLITSRDLEDMYAIRMCSKMDKVEPKDKFRPYQSLNTVKPLSNKKRDLCAAAPPPPKYGDAKVVGLEESLLMMIKQNEQLREVQMAHAAERLRDKSHVIGEVLPSVESTRLYRETIKVEEEYEVRDECEGHDGGDVSFPIDFDEVD